MGTERKKIGQEDLYEVLGGAENFKEAQNEIAQKIPATGLIEYFRGTKDQKGLFQSCGFKTPWL